MDKYETLGVVGEGSYGLVLRCRHRQSGQLVAVKKFIEADEDAAVRRMALREIRMLKKLRHDNLVSMLEVFRRRRRLYLVLELMDHTLLDELEENPGGLSMQIVRRHGFQVLRALDFCHANNIVHRDVKPENVLVSSLGVVKLCDFGFARLLASPSTAYTEYVATRWYRAPELLVGDAKYGKPVDIWATGCLFAEMLSGDPIFPGESDIDQLFQIIRVMGPLSARHQLLAARNPALRALRRSARGSGTSGGAPSSSSGAGGNSARPLARLFPSWTPIALDFVALCLRMDPGERPPAQRLLDHAFFNHDGFPERFLPELRTKVLQEAAANPLLQEIYAAREAKEHKKAATAAAVAAAAAATAFVFPSDNLMGKSRKSAEGKQREQKSEDYRAQDHWREVEKQEEQHKIEQDNRSHEHRMEDHSQDNQQQHWTDKFCTQESNTEEQTEEHKMDGESQSDHREPEYRAMDEEHSSMPPIDDHLSFGVDGESNRLGSHSQLDFHPAQVVFPPSQTVAIQIHEFQPFHELTHRQTGQQQQHLQFSHHFPPPSSHVNQHPPQVHQQSQTTLPPETIIPTRVTLQIDPSNLSGTLLTARTSSQTQKPTLTLHHSSKKGPVVEPPAYLARNQELRLPDVPGASGRKKGQNSTSSVCEYST